MEPGNDYQGDGMSKDLNYYQYDRPELVAEIPADVDRLLDIGCGSGAMSSVIKRDKDVREIWGVEIVPEIIEQARKNPAFDRVLAGSIEQLVHELPRDYFNVIIAGDVLEHLVDPWTTLAELRKALKSDGLIISSMPNIRNLSFIMKLLFTGRFQYRDSGVLDRTHLRFFGRKDIFDLFSEAGFHNVEIFPARPKKQIHKRLGRLIFGSLLTKVFLIKASW